MILANKDSDGIVMLYCKKGILYPVLLNVEQRARLENYLPLALAGKLNVLDRPLGTATFEGGKKNGRKA